MADNLVDLVFDPAYAPVFDPVLVPAVDPVLAPAVAPAVDPALALAVDVVADVVDSGHDSMAGNHTNPFFNISSG